MRLASKVQEWIDNREWEDRVEVDEENQRSRINFSYGINEQSFDLWFETSRTIATTTTTKQRKINNNKSRGSSIFSGHGEKGF